jgi:hypothetical protein
LCEIKRGKGERTNGDGGMLLDSTSCGIDVHVATQWLSSAWRDSRKSKTSLDAGAACVQLDSRRTDAATLRITPVDHIVNCLQLTKLPVKGIERKINNLKSPDTPVKISKSQRQDPSSEI